MPRRSETAGTIGAGSARLDLMMTQEEPEGGRRRGSVTSSLLWASVGQFGYFVLQFGSSVAIARLLGPRELGVFAIAFAVVGLISAIQGIGLNNYLIRAETVDRPVLSTVFTVNLLLCVLLGGIVAAIGLLGARLFDEPGVSRVLFWIAWTPLIGALGFMPLTLMQRDGDFRAISLIRVFSTLPGIAATIALALAGESYMSLAYGQVITAVASTAGACLLAPRHIHLRIGLRGWRDVGRFGLSMAAINGATQLQRQLQNLSLGRLQGLEALGLYSRANNLFSMLFDNVQIVVARVFIVDLSDVVRSEQPLRARYLQILDFTTALLWPVLAGLAVLAGPCVHILYGPKWDGLGPSLSMLCVAGIVWVAVTMAWDLFIVAHETGRQARLELLRSLVGLVLFVAGAAISLEFAAAGRVAEAVFAFLLYRPHIVRITQCRPGDLRPIYMRNASLTFVAIAPSAILMHLYGWSPATPAGPLIVSIGLGLGLWLVALASVRHPLWVFGWAGLRRMRRGSVR